MAPLTKEHNMITFSSLPIGETFVLIIARKRVYYVKTSETQATLVYAFGVVPAGHVQHFSATTMVELL